MKKWLIIQRKAKRKQCFLWLRNLQGLINKCTYKDRRTHSHVHHITYTNSCAFVGWRQKWGMSVRTTYTQQRGFHESKSELTPPRASPPPPPKKGYDLKPPWYRVTFHCLNFYVTLRKRTEIEDNSKYSISVIGSHARGNIF